jgi:hypothetical protein
MHYALMATALLYCRVLEGEKWSANFWIWNAPQFYRARRSQKHLSMEQDLGTDGLINTPTITPTIVSPATAKANAELLNSARAELLSSEEPADGKHSEAPTEL